MKRPKLPKPRKIQRNPHARALGQSLFRKRVVEKPGVYRRRPKHRKLSDEAAE